MSLIGIVLCMITVSVHLCYRFIRISDVGIGMLLSLTNALLLVFTLLWSLMGVLELRILLKAYKNTKNELYDERLNKDKNMAELRRNKFYMSINISYLIIIMCQFVYVIFNWDEVNI